MSFRTRHLQKLSNTACEDDEDDNDDDEATLLDVEYQCYNDQALGSSERYYLGTCK